MSRLPVKAIRFKRLTHAKGLPLPAYQTADAAGLDIVAALPSDEPLVLLPGAFRIVPTGLVIELPRGTEAQIRPRSGLAAKHGITVLNSPGTIDADYRGEIGVILINLGSAPFTIWRGDRIAQMVFALVTRMALKETDILSDTARGSAGFGSTGGRTSGREKKSFAGSRKSVKSATPRATKPNKPTRP